MLLQVSTKKASYLVATDNSHGGDLTPILDWNPRDYAASHHVATSFIITGFGQKATRHLHFNAQDKR